MGSFNAAVQSSDMTMRFIMDGLGERYRIAIDTGLTYPATAPHSRLDHVFTARGLEVLETRVAKQALPVTDHLPLVTHLRWQLPMLMEDGRSTHERL